ncbi:MAG: C40 family peptidase [Pseudomonadota bacterium]
MRYDRRLTPARDDLAAEALRGQIDAPRYAAATPAAVTMPVAPLHPRPDAATVQDTELVFGETVDVYDRSGGWAWVQAAGDGYVGYVAEDALADGAPPQVTDRVISLGASTYARPALKSPPTGRLPFGAQVTVAEEQDGYARIGRDLWVPRPQIRAIATPAADWVAVAEMFVGVPYVWGGRSSWGLDCSALIQLSRQAAGHTCPRDSDMQQAGLGETLVPDDAPGRGDLIFWRGHVGVMLDQTRLLHANAHHMAVAIEPLDEAAPRIAAAGDGEITRRARLDAAASSH